MIKNIGTVLQGVDVVPPVTSGGRLPGNRGRAYHAVQRTGEASPWTRSAI